MRTYLVTGGAGFIGSNYIHYMFKKYGDDIRIINVDKLTYAGNLENLRDVENRDNYTFVRADICDSEAINKIFDENDIDRVVHFAAESHVDRSIRNPEVFVKTNVLGTLVMLNAAKAAWELEDGTFKADKKFLHVSTDEVYGSLENEGEYFYETTPYDPHSPYSVCRSRPCSTEEPGRCPMVWCGRPERKNHPAERTDPERHKIHLRFQRCDPR